MDKNNHYLEHKQRYSGIDNKLTPESVKGAILDLIDANWALLGL